MLQWQIIRGYAATWSAHIRFSASLALVACVAAFTIWEKIWKYLRELIPCQRGLWLKISIREGKLSPRWLHFDGAGIRHLKKPRAPVREKKNYDGFMVQWQCLMSFEKLTWPSNCSLRFPVSFFNFPSHRPIDGKSSPSRAVLHSSLTHMSVFLPFVWRCLI